MTYIRYPRPRVALASSRPIVGVLSLILILSLLATAQPGSSLAIPRQQPASALMPSLADLPIAFVPNVGQSDPGVAFQAQGLGGMLLFQPDQIVLRLPAPSDSPDAIAASGADSQPLGASKIAVIDASARREAVVRLRFLGANPRPNVRSADQLTGIVNYMLGNDPTRWRTNIPTYGALRYERLYPGIDLRYDGAGGRLKGTYLLEPGADPAQIRWRYEGVGSVAVDSGGDLVATLAQGSAALREAAPVAWQTINGRQVPVDVRYSIAPDSTIGFTVGAYDRSLPLVLDPTLDYSTYIGSNGDDEGRSIAVDETGAIYVTGNTNSISFPPGSGSNNGGVDVFVIKLDAEGKQAIYSTYLGGDSTDLVSGIVAGSGGAVHITGSTYSANFPPVRPADALAEDVYDTTLDGEIDAFVTTLGAAGTPAFSVYLGGNQKDFGTGIALDSGQNLYLTGRTESPDFPVANGRDSTLGGFADAFVTKLVASRRLTAYSTYLGGSSSDMGNAIAVDTGGNAYITGQTSSTDFPKLGSARPPVYAGGVTDAFVTKLDASGRLLVYSIDLGGTDFDEGMGIALDNEANAYVTGTTQSADFPAPNGYQRFFQGRTDAFVSKINVSGSAMEYSTFVGGTSDDAGQDIVVDNQGAATIIGSTKSYDFPNGSAVQSTRNGDIDAFITKLRPTGSTIEYSTYFGGTIEDYGYGIAWGCVSGTCATYITGTARSRDFPTMEGSWRPNYSGGQFDAFVARFGAFPTGPRLYLEPPMKFIGVNQTFSVDVKVDSAETDIDTVDAYLTYDPQYLEVVDPSGNETDMISPTTTISNLHVNYNTVDDVAGRIDFSATRLVTDTSQSRLLPRTFTAAKIYFRTRETTTGVAPTTISFLHQGARRSDLYHKGAARSATLGKSNIRILSGAVLNGKIGLEQRGTPPNPRWATPLYRGDNNGIVVYDNLASANPQTLGYFRTDTDNNGRFSVFLREIEGGQYDIQVKGVDTLSNVRRANLQTADLIDFGALCVGDSSGDDMINGADVSYLVPFFLTDDSLPNFPTEGDANKDKRIDREDVNAIKGNFLKTGFIPDSAAPSACAPPATQGFAAEQTLADQAADPEMGIAATERAAISLYPEELTVVAGKVFTVSLNVDLKGNLVDTIDVFINANPNELVFVDREGNEMGLDELQGEIELDLAALNNSSCETTHNDVVKKSAAHTEANASITCYRAPFLPNTFTLATLRVKANRITQPAKITLAIEGARLQDKVRTSNVYKSGAAVDTLRTGTTVTVVSLTKTLHLPLANW